MAHLELRKVTKSYGNALALRDIVLATKDNEFVTVVGPSGCGKTTLLRTIAGLESIDSGSLHINEHPITNVPPRLRDVAMVFQGESLYPHLSVFENLAFPLRVRWTPKSEIAERVEATAETLDVAELLKRMPSTLSGGQRQRVAIGRALVRNPKVFLFDEPFSHLDAHLRRQFRVELMRLRESWSATTLFVTHDHEEALELGQRVAVMHHATLHQFDEPHVIRQSPANDFVAQFINVGASRPAP